MRLFKCWNADITVNHDIMVMWAEDEKEAINKIVEARSKDECFRDWLLYDTGLDEIINDLKGNYEVFEHLVKGNIDEFAKDVYRAIDLKNWTIEEYFVNRYSDVFACYESYLDKEDSCQVVSVPFDAHDSEEYIYRALAERMAEEHYFKLHIEEVACNAGLVEDFWRDSKGYVFDCGYHFDIRQDIYDKFDGDKVKANKYIEDCFVSNAKEFFKEEPGYSDIFLEHVKNYDPDTETSFCQEFYIYCTRKLIEEGKYTSYEIEKVTV